MAAIKLNPVRKRQEHVFNSDTSGLATGVLTGDHDSILEGISRTGNVDHDWTFLKELFASKINEVLKSYFSERGFLGLVEHSFEIRSEELLGLLEKFQQDAPFTVQRLAEVLINPSQYQSTHKLMNCLEKLLSVTLTVPTRE